MYNVQYNITAYANIKTWKEKQMLSSSWDRRPFGHNRHGPKRVGLCPFRGLGPHLTQCCLGRGLPPCQVASLSIQPFGHNSHGPKIGGGAVPLLRGAESPSNIMWSNTLWPESRHTSIPSFILIHPTVWSQLQLHIPGTRYCLTLDLVILYTPLKTPQNTPVPTVLT